MIVHITPYVLVKNCILIEISSSLNKTGETMTTNQKQALMTMFQANSYPGRKEICHVASKVGTSKLRIEQWLAVRRKKKRAEGVLLPGE